MITEKPKVLLYTDGACKNNPGKGGYGVVLLYTKKDGSVEKKTISGSAENTTNNQMELTACIVGLKALKTSCVVDLFSDSKYVIDGMTKWVADWIKKGWKTANKKSVANVELWQELVEIAKQHDITWHWVKGHADDEYNNEADFLARKEADTL